MINFSYYQKCTKSLRHSYTITNKMMYFFSGGNSFASVLQGKKQSVTATNYKSIIESSVTNYNEFSKGQ